MCTPHACDCQTDKPKHHRSFSDFGTLYFYTPTTLIWQNLLGKFLNLNTIYRDQMYRHLHNTVNNKWIKEERKWWSITRLKKWWWTPPKHFHFCLWITCRCCVDLFGNLLDSTKMSWVLLSSNAPPLSSSMELGN